MGVPYHNILRAVLLRRNALIGVLPADIEASYAGTITDASVDSADWPYTSIIDDTLFCAGQLAAACCATGQHPQAVYFRSFLELAHGAVIPAVDNAGKPRIGPLGDVYDEVTDARLTLKTPQDIRRRRANPGSLWSLPVYWYFIDNRNGRIDHTLSTDARLTCWVFSMADERAKMEANEDMTLPDDWAEALLCGACSLGVRDDAGQNQAGIYRAYYNDALSALSSNQSIPPAAWGQTMEATA